MTDSPDRETIVAIGRENPDGFKTGYDHPDPEFAAKYGERPLRYLEDTDESVQ